jgi:hypothetical protein
MSGFAIALMLPFAIWGLIDMYGCYRFGRTDGIDFTASILRWWQIKSLVATQAKRMLEKFPWLSQDLAERWGVRPDDGRVT